MLLCHLNLENILMRYLYGIILFMLCATVSAQDGLKRPDIPGELMIDIGLNYWDEVSENLDQKGWPSKSIALYYIKRKELSPKLSFYYGAGLGMEKFSLGNQNTLFSTADSAYVDAFPGAASLDKNRLAVTYLDVPFELRFHPKGTQDGEGFFVGVGGIAGIRMNAHTKWKYEANGETVKQKLTGKYDLNSFRYGTQVRLGFRGVHIFYKQYFSKVFNDDVNIGDTGAGGFNPTFRTFGINVTGF